MYTVLLVDSDQDRIQVISQEFPTDWRVIKASSSEEVLRLLAEEPTIAQVVCASRFGCNETATSLYVDISDQLAAMRINMVVVVWEEDELDSLEELYLDSQGVGLVFTSEEMSQVLFPTASVQEYVW